MHIELEGPVLGPIMDELKTCRRTNPTVSARAIVKMALEEYFDNGGRTWLARHADRCAR